MHNNISFSKELIAQIVHCVEDAVGDEIQADIRRNKLTTTNSVPARIWDLLNTNLYNNLRTQNCTIAKANRGPWEMLVVFEKETKCILTFMREKRYLELQKRQRCRTRMHYIDMLTKQFNNELTSDNQMTLFPHSFSDEDNLAKYVNTLLQDLGGDIDCVRHHVLILFDTIGFQLTHIRAVKITPSLDIAVGCEQDWSHFISSTESVVVERVGDSESFNNPTKGLSLKPKAITRQNKKLKTKITNMEEQVVKD